MNDRHAGRSSGAGPCALSGDLPECFRPNGRVILRLWVPTPYEHESWAAALVTAAGLALLAGLIVLIGWSMLRRAVPPVPDQALADLQDDVAAITSVARRD
jgi:Putative Actinobacterial Holin-X, holin superfamily III